MIARLPFREQLGAALPLLAGTLIGGAFSYVAVTLSARLLGAADYGLLGTLLSLTSVIVVALRPFHSAATYAASLTLTRGDESVVAEIAGGLLGVCVAGGSAIYIVVALLSTPIRAALQITNDQWGLVLLVPLVSSLAYWQGLSGLLFGVQRFRKYAFATVLDAGVRAAVIAPLVAWYGVSGAVAGYVVGSIAANAYGIRALGGLAWPTAHRVVRSDMAHIAGDWVWLTLLIASLQNLDIVFLRSYADAETVGWYAAASALANLGFTASAPLYLPMYARLVAAHSESRATLSMLLGTLAPILLAGAVAVLGAGWLGPTVTRLIFGDEFAVAGRLLPLLLVKTTALLGLLLVGQYAIALERTAAVAVGSILAVLTLGSLAVLRLPPEDVALLTGMGAASAALLVGLLLVTANQTGWRR